MKRRGGSGEAEHWLLRWALWAMLYALALGGHPWRFPEGGRYWREGRLMSEHADARNKQAYP
jgi:hypothetical protein